MNLLPEFQAKGFAIKAMLQKPLSVGVLRQKIREILKIEDVDTQGPPAR
jgi:hypothetical protein